MKATCVFAALAALAAPAMAITTVDELDLTMYTGRWYQMYADLAVTQTFEKDGVCVTADYQLVGDSVAVTNTQNDKTVDGELVVVTGTGTLPDSSEPGQLDIKFDAPVPSFVTGKYWVIALGEVIDGQYQYSVVTDNFGQTLFVLARDVDEFKAKYDAEVLQILDDNGFSGFLYGPIETVQEDGCQYAAEPAAFKAPENLEAAVGLGSYCPGSDAFIHASCDTSVTFEESCDVVIDEIQARVAGQYDQWYDAHNNGTYAIKSASSSALSLERVTGNGQYTDKINLEFTASGSGCSANACSESQVTSIIDYGTNHCNLIVLYGGSADGFRYVNTDLHISESINSCSDSTSACNLV